MDPVVSVVNVVAAEIKMYIFVGLEKKKKKNKMWLKFFFPGF